MRQLRRFLLPPALAGLALLLLLPAACRERAPAVIADSAGAPELPARDMMTAPPPPPTVAPAAAPAVAAEAQEMRRVAAGNVASDAGLHARSAPLLGAGDPAGAMLIRQGQASIEVKHLDDAVAKVRQTAAQFGGFVANASIRSGREETRAATLEVRVPSTQFDALVGALSGMGRVESVTASAQDVGDEYVDMAARMANARRLEARLIEMMATRTGKLSDVLTMEQELARVREEIERYEGRLRFLATRTSLSTLQIALHESLPLIERQPGPGPIAEAFAHAWERLVATVAWSIGMLGVLLPLALAGWAAWRGARWIAGRRPTPTEGVSAKA